jgi:hypothetical protein
MTAVAILLVVPVLLLVLMVAMERVERWAEKPPVDPPG